MNNNYFYPEDIEQRNIIDRFANFVAKNGTDFEQMTKQKQHGNPMFQFLFGGIHSDYYQYRLLEERSMLENNGHMRLNTSDYLENKATASLIPPSNQFAHGFDFTQTDYFQNYNVIGDMTKRLENLNMSLSALQEEHYSRLNDSQQNLTTESTAINKEKITKCLITMDYYRLLKIKERCTSLNINFELMECLIQALIGSCTKENICNGKNFVIENMMKDNKTSQLICDYLLYLVSKSNIFIEKLHIIYFLNDLLHYCKRKVVTNLLHAIESVIVLIYSMCVLIADDEGKIKLNKVLSLWESNNYVRNETLQSMKMINGNPAMYLNDWQISEINKMKLEEDEGILRDTMIPIGETISGIFSESKMRLSNLEANHNQLKYELKIKEENIQLEIYQLEREIKTSEAENRKNSRENFNQNYSDYQDNDYSIHPMPSYDISFHMPDFTKPPPGFTMHEVPCSNAEPQFISLPHQQPEIPANSRPSIPYWRLPAAVMVAHLKLAQYEYSPIDANAIQLPQLRPPSKRLIDVTNTFYQPPSHDRPRDTEGWEKLGLHEFYKAKEKAKNGGIPDDFINSLHDKQNREDFRESIQLNERLMDTDYRHMELNDMNDFRPSFVDHKCPNPDFNFHHSQSSHYGNSNPNCSPRMNNQRSLLGSPWEEFRHTSFNSNQDIGITRNMNYNTNNRMPPSLLGGPPRHMPPKVTPLMSLDISNNFKRHNQNQRPKRHNYSRNDDDYSYNDRNRSRRRYVSRSRSPYDRSISRSRSRSRSSRYSRSRSRSYSKSRSPSRSRSRSSSSRSSDKRPYKGGFIARKSRSRSYSRSRSGSRSPDSKYQFEANPNKIKHNNYENTEDSTSQTNCYTGGSANEDVFSRFRQRKSVGYSELMKERIEKRIAIQEDQIENY